MSSVGGLLRLGVVLLVASTAGCDKPAPEVPATSATAAPEARTWPPAFDDHSTTDTLTGPAAALDLAGDPDAARFRSQLGGAKVANFAGHRAFVTWGCGTMCQSGALLDLRTGKSLDLAPLDLGCGAIEHRVSSSLVIWGADTTAHTYSRCRALLPRYFVWEGGSLRELHDPSGMSPTRVDSNLRIPLKNGSAALFTDRSGEMEVANFRYEGVVPRIPFHAVSASYYEATGVFLVHDSTGRRTGVYALPVASPDGREVVVASMDLLQIVRTNGIFIYRVEGDTLVETWRHETMDWGPKEAIWQLRDTIYILKAVPVGGHPDRTREVPAYIAREGGRWVLHGATVEEDTLYAD
jgi:hypothetical protein